jgi:hypothetical protein
MEPIELPIACTLDAAGQAEQARRWATLIDTAAIGRTATADGIELRFHPHQGVADELDQLVAVERGCCPWADWQIERTDAALILRATAPRDGVAALRAMFSALATS